MPGKDQTDEFEFPRSFERGSIEAISLTVSIIWIGPSFHVRLSVAPLKHRLTIALLLLLPGRFHVRLSVAPLKPSTNRAREAGRLRFHVRLSVAPLKPAIVQDYKLAANEFPRSFERGSIEASVSDDSGVAACRVSTFV